MHPIKDIKLIKDLLAEDPIAHLNTIGRIKNSENVEIYVDDHQKPRGFVLKDGYWAIPYSKDEEILSQILNNFAFPDYVGFCGLPMAWANKIKESLTEYELDWDEHCQLYYLPEENIEKISLVEVLPSLTIEDIDIVDYHYTYKEEGSREYLLECIQKRPSSVIIEEGKPVSWALVREDNSMGVMYTIEEYRKKGLAKKITGDLVRKVVERGNIPYVHIVVTNEASKNLARELGLVYWGDVLWFGLKKKGMITKEE
ncbi:GNAT family N-acetyltransferase [Alkaliphilus transvaalensis]|uniref:GNAT family N-acetyltransferase n=1 Tax=Alkaliphilus transvaalensis TaxID=114628 RepID=UPI00047B1F4B|nr:GNAT family N-acetyltransferase [Alkaliphilus transvaalensis]